MKFRDIIGYFNSFRRDENSDSQSDKYIFSIELEAISEHPVVGTEALIAEGQSNGKKDLPPKEFEGLDVTERKVFSAYERLIDAETKGYMRDQSRLVSKLKSLNSRLFLSDMNADHFLEDDHSILVDQARSDMETKILKKKNDIENKKNRACDAEKEYQAFKEENQLNHDLDLPTKRWSRAKPWLWLVVILVVESVLNGWFFGQQIGGSNYLRFTAEALLISTVNVTILALLIRSCWKYLYHIQIHLKVWSVIGLIIFSISALIFNLGAAHLRDAIPDDHPASGDECFFEKAYSQEALCLLLNEKANLAEFEAYAFFLLGIGFILFGIFKWRNIFPGYPEHAKKQRQFQEARNQLQKECTSLKADLDKIYLDARRKLTSSSTHEDRQSILILINEIDKKGYDRLIVGKHISRKLAKLVKRSSKNRDDRLSDGKDIPSILDDYKLASKLLRNIQDKYKDYRCSVDEVSRRCERAIEFYRIANRLARADVSSVPSKWDDKWTPDWNTSEGLDDSGLCSSEDAQAMHDKELQYIEGRLDPFYRKAIEEIDSLSKCSETIPDEISATENKD